MIPNNYLNIIHDDYFIANSNLSSTSSVIENYEENSSNNYPQEKILTFFMDFQPQLISTPRPSVRNRRDKTILPPIIEKRNVKDERIYSTPKQQSVKQFIKTFFQTLLRTIFQFNTKSQI
ncbi:hypothetical protein SNEBB_002744 [Seison nebaliae]|nr:hypothetical protein SNEBB_002744 [Seison nebaliae]